MKTNIILIGMPGSGKTTIAKYLSWALEMPIIDIDDLIEESMQRSAGDTLTKYGEEKFLDFEKEISLKLKPKHSIISCTGSIPLRKEAMDYLRTIGYAILINIPLDKIKNRLEIMKVDRIVGMSNGRMTLDEVLNYRDGIYKQSYDFIFNDDGVGNKKEMFKKFLDFLLKLPIANELGLKVNEDNLKVVYDEYKGFE
ncbi:MAG: shikimate kinase [Candidatus Gracilibacteria bacterium]|nr:shikimate kinase [Candidatus Gracilibacteria bacterium]